MNLDKDNLPAVVYKYNPFKEEKEIKPPTKKQITWRKRAILFWRLRGLNYIVPKDIAVDDYITKEEYGLLEQFNRIVNTLNNGFTKNSIKLGFNAKHRCWCGKVAKYYSEHSTFISKRFGYSEYLTERRYCCDEHKSFYNNNELKELK